MLKHSKFLGILILLVVAMLLYLLSFNGLGVDNGQIEEERGEEKNLNSFIQSIIYKSRPRKVMPNVTLKLNR